MVNLATSNFSNNNQSNKYATIRLDLMTYERHTGLLFYSLSY